MKSKTLATLVTSVVVIILTASFGIAEVVITQINNFPFFQFGCLIVGGLIIVSLKHKFDKLYTSEVIGSFALYTLLVSLFTTPVIDFVKTIVS
jgi:hypothetical protein